MHYKEVDGVVVEVEDLLEWARWFEDADRSVARTEVGPYTVSTVFLGLDHSFGRGEPVLYETMVFERDSATPGNDLDSDRYHTRREALAGHTRIVAKYLEEKP